MDTLLRARDVHFAWQDREVLRGISLDVRQGSVMCLMGMNGCGKSTFLDCILGENKPTSGTIEMRGVDVVNARAQERARLVSYVPQTHERTFPYTVERMVLMGRTVYEGAMGTADVEDLELVRQALEQCGITRLSQRVCSELSGGEMQMVLLARALVQQAPLMVLDEPTAHLDFKNELVFLEAVETLVREQGVTVLMATHAPNQAFHLDSAGIPVQVALMHDGVIARTGTPEEVLTPDSLMRYFDVSAQMAHVRLDEVTDEAAGESERVLTQIVPLGTLRSGGTAEDARDDDPRAGTYDDADSQVAAHDTTAPRPVGGVTRRRAAIPQTPEKDDPAAHGRHRKR
jgi:iron complex transport system ATP-binding protein